MSNDKNIENYRKQIEAKRTALGKKPRVSYITNGLLSISDKKYNLNVLANLQQCVSVVQDLVLFTITSKEANKLLGTSVVMDMDGYTPEDYISDIKQRVDSIKWNEENKKLEVMDAKLAQLLSDKAKTELSIADIAKELSLD